MGKKGETLAANLDRALQIIDDAGVVIRQNSWQFPLTAGNTPSYSLIYVMIKTNTHNRPPHPTICVISCHLNVFFYYVVCNCCCFIAFVLPFSVLECPEGHLYINILLLLFLLLQLIHFKSKAAPKHIYCILSLTFETSELNNDR